MVLVFRQSFENHSIRAKQSWSWQQDTFFEVRVFQLNTSSYRSTNILALYRQHEMAEKREYGDRIREVEYAVFIPLVFSTTYRIFTLCKEHTYHKSSYFMQCAAACALAKTLHERPARLKGVESLNDPRHLSCSEHQQQNPLMHTK